MFSFSLITTELVQLFSKQIDFIYCLFLIATKKREKNRAQIAMKCIESKKKNPKNRRNGRCKKLKYGCFFLLRKVRKKSVPNENEISLEHDMLLTATLSQRKDTTLTNSLHFFCHHFPVFLTFWPISQLKCLFLIKSLYFFPFSLFLPFIKI